MFASQGTARRHVQAVILGIVLVAAGPVQPPTIMAAGPTPAPVATARPVEPSADPSSNPVAPEGAGSLAETPQACGSAGPGQVTIGPAVDLNAVIIDGSAGATSDLYLESSSDSGTVAPRS